MGIVVQIRPVLPHYQTNDQIVKIQSNWTTNIPHYHHPNALISHYQLYRKTLSRTPIHQLCLNIRMVMATMALMSSANDQFQW